MFILSTIEYFLIAFYIPSRRAFVQGKRLGYSESLQAIKPLSNFGEPGPAGTTAGKTLWLVLLARGKKGMQELCQDKYIQNFSPQKYR